MDTASVRTKIAQHTALARDCAALIWAWRCRGGWKQRQGSRLQRPLTASMQTVTVPSSLAVTESAGCAKRHSDSARLHAPRWYSRHTYSRYPGSYQHKPPLHFIYHCSAPTDHLFNHAIGRARFIFKRLQVNRNQPRRIETTPQEILQSTFLILVCTVASYN